MYTQFNLCIKVSKNCKGHPALPVMTVVDYYVKEGYSITESLRELTQISNFLPHNEIKSWPLTCLGMVVEKLWSLGLQERTEVWIMAWRRYWRNNKGCEQSNHGYWYENIQSFRKKKRIQIVIEYLFNKLNVYKQIWNKLLIKNAKALMTAFLCYMIPFCYAFWTQTKCTE